MHGPSSVWLFIRGGAIWDFFDCKISLCLQTDMKNIIQKLIFSAIILVMNSGGGGVR